MVTHEDYIQQEISKLGPHACGCSDFEVIVREDCDLESLRKHFGNSSAWAKVLCRECHLRYGNGLVKWMAKPGNLKPKKSRKGQAFYADWWRKRLGGTLICWLCEMKETETSSGFQHHHVDWRCEDGTDYPPEDIRMCCSPCHDILTSIRRTQINRAKVIIKTNNDWCSADDCLCAINMRCNHEDRENCESRMVG